MGIGSGKKKSITMKTKIGRYIAGAAAHCGGARFRGQATAFIHSQSLISTNPQNPYGTVNVKPSKSLSYMIFDFNRMLESQPPPSNTNICKALTRLSRMGHHSTVLSLYREMGTRLVPLPPSLFTLNVVINSCCKLENSVGVGYGFSLFGAIVKLGFEPNTITFNNLIKALFSESRNADALRLFHKLTKKCEPNVYSYGIVIDGLCNMGNLRVALEVLRDMKMGRFSPNKEIYTAIVYGLCESGKVGLSFSFVGEMVKRGVVPDLVTLSILIKGLFMEGEVNAGLKLFHKLPEILKNDRRDQIMYGIVIDGLCKTGNVMAAMDLLIDMEGGRCNPDAEIYNALIDGLCNNRRVDLALSFVGEMAKKCVMPNLVTLNNLIKGHFLVGEGNAALKLFYKLPVVLKNVQRNRITYGTVIDGLCKMGYVDKAMTVFIDMKRGSCSPKERIYTALMDGLFKSGRADEALGLFEEMGKKRVTPDVVTYSVLINGLCVNGKLWDAWELFERLLTNGVRPDVVMYTTMIYGFCQEGFLEEAEELILKMEENGCKPGNATYNAIICGFLKWKQIYKAMEFMKMMVERNFSPHASSISTLTNLFGFGKPKCETN